MCKNPGVFILFRDRMCKNPLVFEHPMRKKWKNPPGFEHRKPKKWSLFSDWCRKTPFSTKNQLSEPLFKGVSDYWVPELKWLSSAWAGKMSIWKVKLVSGSTFFGGSRLLNSWAEIAFQRLGGKNVNLICKNDLLEHIFRVHPIIEFIGWNGFPALGPEKWQFDS